MIGALVGFVLAMAGAALFAGMETGLYSLERVRVQVAASAGDRRAKRLLSFISNPTPAVCMLLIGTNITHFVLAACTARLVDQWINPENIFTRQVINTAILTPLLFVLGDLVPKNLFMMRPTLLMRAVEPVLSGLLAVFRPIVTPIVKIGEAAARAEAGSERSASLFDRGAIHFMLTVDDEAAHLTPEQRALAERVLKLRGVKVRDKMVQKADVAAIDLSVSADEIVSIGARTGHSRLPVWSPDHSAFIGYLSVVDAATVDPADFRVGNALHGMPEVDADLPLTAALYRLQRSGRPLATVTTGRGRSTVGLIAVSDIVEALWKAD